MNDASRLLRELLYESGNDILVALREDFTPSEMARLSDLIGSRIFDVLVNLTAPPVHAAPTQGGNNDGNPAISAPALPSTPADGGAGQAGHAYPSAPGWEDVGLSPRSTLNGPWSSREGWIVDLRLPQQPTTITRPPSWPYADLFILDWYDVPWWVATGPRHGRPALTRPRVLHACLFRPRSRPKLPGSLLPSGDERGENSAPSSSLSVLSPSRCQLTYSSARSSTCQEQKRRALLWFDLCC